MKYLALMDELFSVLVNCFLIIYVPSKLNFELGYWEFG